MTDWFEFTTGLTNAEIQDCCLQDVACQLARKGIRRRNYVKRACQTARTRIRSTRIRTRRDVVFLFSYTCIESKSKQYLKTRRSNVRLGNIDLE